ncbi:MAG: nucleotidyltransferase substrate binding protein [Bacteroidales bacterium]|nr:nucleotidyltransferase substrate binding protein [Bacteroidales bacterium]
MSNQDIRWIQHFHNFKKTLSQLQKFIDKGNSNEFEEQGLTQVFEYNYDFVLNTIKDFYEDQGETGIQGSRDAIRAAFSC